MPSLTRRVVRRARAAAATVRHGPRRILARRLADAGLVDREWYQRQTGRTFGSDRAAALHYLGTGRRAGWSPHPLVEPEWIAPTGWATARTDPVQLYLAGHSARGGPHPSFDDAAYLATLTSGAAATASADRGGVLGAYLRQHGPDDPLPVPTGAAPTTLRRVGERVGSAVDLVAAQNARRGVRTSTSWDPAADARYVAEWSAAAVVPPAGLGPDQPLVSIVLPVRNRPDQIRTAIASVQAQTFDGWELLVVDDGSTDSTPDVVATLAAGDPRIRLVRIAASGASAARNAGLEAARGHFVAFLDSDNAWVPHFLAVTLAAMTADDLRAAYAVVEMRGATSTRYLAHSGGRADLEVANHIDLNVFVADLALVRSVGGFDPTLRRMIDWDLVLKVAATDEPVLLPFVGVHYGDDSAQADRISVREPTSWGEVMLARNLVDWAGLAEVVAARAAGRTSVVVSVKDDWAAALTLVDGALADPASDVDVVLVDRASRAAVARILAARYGDDPRVQVLRMPRDARVAVAWSLGLAATTGAVVVLVDARCTLRASGSPLGEPWWAPLRAALDDPTVAAVAPLVLTETGTIASAGLGSRGPGVAPYPLFEDAAPEDVVAGGRLDVAGLGDDALALRADDLVTARGANPWYVTGLWGADLSLRVASAASGTGVTRRLVVVPDVRLVRTSGSEPVAVADVAGLLDRVGSLLPDADRWGEAEAFGRVGLAAGPVEAPAVGGLAVTAVVRAPATIGSGPAAGRPALRWAIKIAAPTGDQGDKWGDVHFASDLAAALRRLGQHACVDRRPAHDRSTAHLDDVTVNLRGLATPTLRDEQVNVLWVISHPDLVTPEEVRSYDLAFAASLTWSAAMSERAGVPVEPLLQATDPDRFHPDLAEPSTGPAALFVGNSRGVQRPVVRDAIAAGVDLAVYGTRWADFIDERYVRGAYLPNETVGAAYRSAGVVLNDHWPDMAAQGFISNRVFDAVAAGGRVLSDPVDGLEETFEGAARAYRTVDELRRWVGPERGAAFPDEQRLREISARVRREHSFDARAARLLDAVATARISRTRRGVGQVEPGPAQASS
jgi:hypothetical protein